MQWIDGSFLESIEILESRPPNDVDVVTFFRLPAGLTQKNLFNRKPELFDHDRVKADFLVDSYPICLDNSAEYLIEQSAYWYGVWSHRRTLAWKGFVELGLEPATDAAAVAILAAGPGGTIP